MYKLKTSKSIRKRLKFTSSGKLLRRQSGRNHLLQKKSSKSKRQLRKIAYISSGEYKVMKSKMMKFI